MNQAVVDGGKATQMLQRADGSEVCIVAQECYGLGLTRSVFVYVRWRERPEHPWKLANDRPHPDWKTMPLNDYVKFGRSEMLRLASPGEILKTVNALKTH